MTGTPLDLTPFGALLKSVSLLYWLPALVLIALSLWLIDRWWLKLGVVAVIAAAFALPAWRYKEATEKAQQVQYDTAKARVDAAKARFEMRCKEAGDVVRRTVPDVAGIVLLKVPPKHDFTRVADPLYPAAARFGEPTDDWYIRSWLRWPPPPLRPAPGASAPDLGTRPVGYEFVDVVDEASSVRYRYRLVSRQTSEKPRMWSTDLVREPTTAPRPRYGITYEDVLDAVDRQHWVAGDVIRVVDLETSEVIAERRRFVWDTGLGGTGGRQPWPWAGGYGKRCPIGAGRLDEIKPKFVHPVLIPSKEE